MLGKLKGNRHSKGTSETRENEGESMEHNEIKKQRGTSHGKGHIIRKIQK